MHVWRSTLRAGVASAGTGLVSTYLCEAGVKIEDGPLGSLAACMFLSCSLSSSSITRVLSLSVSFPSLQPQHFYFWTLELFQTPFCLSQVYFLLFKLQDGFGAMSRKKENHVSLCNREGVLFKRNIITWVDWGSGASWDCRNTLGEVHFWLSRMEGGGGVVLSLLA